MAAGRLDIPAIVVGCGHRPSGRCRGEHVDFDDVFLHAWHVATGKMTVEELAEMSSCAVTGPGVTAVPAISGSVNTLPTAVKPNGGSTSSRRPR
jgi:dihydroxy-acid dehydratase